MSELEQGSQEDKFFGVRSSVGETDEEVTVEVIDDTPESERKPDKKLSSEDGDDITEEELQGYGEKVRKRINKMTARNHAERRARGEAERQLSEHERISKMLHEENLKLKKLLRQGQTAIVDTVSQKTELELANAEEEFKSAHESGDTQKIAEAQRKLTDAQIRQRDLQGRSARLKKAPQTEAQAEAPAPAAPPKLSAKQEQWLGENPWFVTEELSEEQLANMSEEELEKRELDEAMTAAAYATHHSLTRRSGGRITNEDAYYKEVDRRMRLNFPQVFAEPGSEMEAQAEVSRSHPVSRSNTNVVAPTPRRNNGAKPRSVRLTTSQAEIAKKFGLTNEQYADHFMKLQQQK